MYTNRSRLGEPTEPITTLRMRKDVCPPSYAPGEREKSKTSGLLSPDVTQSGGRLLIADFAVDSPGVRSSTKQEKLLQDTLAAFERDKDLRFRIAGFTDCLGEEKGNLSLRQERARAVFNLLGSSAQSRVVSVGPAPAGTFVPGTDNGTLEGRARNRSAVIEFWRDIKTTPPIPGIPESVKEAIEKEPEGPMEVERRRREAAKKQFGPLPAQKKKALADQIRQRLRDEGVPDWAIDELFKTAAPAGRFAANIALNRMNVSDAAKQFVNDRLKDIFDWKF